MDGLEDARGNVTRQAAVVDTSSPPRAYAASEVSVQLATGGSTR